MSPLPRSPPLLAYPESSDCMMREDLAGSPGREVGLDLTGDDFHRRSLGRDNQVDACRSRELAILQIAFSTSSGAVIIKCCNSSISMTI